MTVSKYQSYIEWLSWFHNKNKKRQWNYWYEKKITETGKAVAVEHN